MTALVHKRSAPCAIEALEVFQVRPTCAQIEKAGYHPFYSISSVDGQVLEFAYQGSGDIFVDLSRTVLTLQCRVMDGTNTLRANVAVGPAPNPIASMFTQCDIFLNNKLVTSSNNLYPYRAFVETTNSSSYEAVTHQLDLQAFWPDEPGQHEQADPAKNKAFGARRDICPQSKLFEIAGPLYTDITNQPCALVSNVDIRIRLTRSPDAFALMAFDSVATASLTAFDASNCKIEIKEALLELWLMQLKPEPQLAIERTLLRQNAVYNLLRTELKSFTIPAGSTTFTREHISLGLTPKVAYVFMVETQAQQGSRTKNPFNFKHFNLGKISLNIDGQENPVNGIRCNFSTANPMYTKAYKSMLDVTGKWRSDDIYMFSYREYAMGNTVFGFQIAPELVPGAFNLVRNSNIRLDMKFDKTTTDNITVIVMFVYDATLEIDANWEIYHDMST